MNKPVQSIQIVDGDVTYAFDAVITAEHAHKLKIAEEAADLGSKKHINYAIRQPSQLTLEVSVADTVTSSNDPLTDGGAKRSETAYAKLYDLQDKRHLLTVITRMHVFTKMLVESITISESQELQNEMRAAIVLKEMTIIPKKKKKKANEDKDTGNFFDSLFGGIQLDTAIKEAVDDVFGWFGFGKKNGTTQK